ncbi:hypothetical protein [Serratia proteamaculans]|uniref:hypothetical protein n=1 Tax=Serratia proteamaculans TaxID=28151 RepID=UPI003CFE95E4
MSRPLKVVALSGGTWRPSRTLVLTQALLAELAEQLPIDSKLIELGDIARPLGAALSRQELPAEIEAELHYIGKQIANAIEIEWLNARKKFGWSAVSGLILS